MMHKVPNCNNMVTQLLRERQGFTNQSPHTLPQRVVQSLNITGFSRFFAKGPMTLAGVVPVHTLPKNRCSRSHTSGKQAARIAKALLLTAENDLQRKAQQSHGYRHQSLTRPIVCSL